MADPVREAAAVAGSAPLGLASAQAAPTAVPSNSQAKEQTAARGGADDYSRGAWPAIGFQ
jgi:hypothetical protein